jgi:hypothetical protein
MSNFMHIGQPVIYKRKNLAARISAKKAGNLCKLLRSSLHHEARFRGSRFAVRCTIKQGLLA